MISSDTILFCAPSVHFEGLESGYKQKMDTQANPASIDFSKEDRTDCFLLQVEQEFLNKHNSFTYDDLADDNKGKAHAGLKNAGITEDTTGNSGKFIKSLCEEGVPNRLYLGHLRKKNAAGEFVTVHENNGHLGVLDSPKGADRLWGTFAYSSFPDPNQA